MKLTKIILVLILVIVLSCIFLSVEGFRGGRRGWGRGGSGGWRRRGRFHRPNRFYGPGVRYGRGIYNYRFDYPWYYPWFMSNGLCKKGCSDLGNGSVGCVNPGSSYDQCLFASDCYGC
jgi:hypothetical protein